jgi:hypothetical protein
MENDTSWHGTSLSSLMKIIVHEDMLLVTPKASVMESCKNRVSAATIQERIGFETFL